MSIGCCDGLAASNSGLLKVTLLSTILWIRISATGFSYCKMDGACALLMGGMNTSFQSMWNVAVASSGQLGGLTVSCVSLSVSVCALKGNGFSYQHQTQ